MALTANRNVNHYVDQMLRTYPVAAGKHVFHGALVGLSSAGYAQPLIAGEPFVGIAYEEMDNTGGVAGAKKVRVYTQGDFDMTLSGAVQSDLGRPVFASADDTLTFTAAGNSFVGIAQDLVSSGLIILRTGASSKRIKTVTHAVEDLGSGADIAARSVHRFEVEGWMTAARVVNQATAAAGIDNSNTCVVTVGINAGTVASLTFNATTTFPAANGAKDLGAMTNAHAVAGDVLTLAVTNGTSANPGSFLVEVDYV